jgi:hypothetical protein
MWMLAAMSLTGCRKVEPAPAELDDLFHWFWGQLDEADDEVLAEGLVNLHAAVDGDRIEEATDGTVSDLTDAEARLVGVDADPSLAAGIFLVNTFPCAWGQLEEILSFGEQDELYEGIYHSYSRDFSVDRDAWLRGDPDRLEYVLSYESDVLGSTYTASSDGTIRRVEDLDTEVAPFGTFLVQRSVMPEPGSFEEGSNKTMDQDYQLEIYWSPKKGTILHAYAMWRQADWGSGFDSDSATAQRVLLNNLVAWDRDTAALCEEGRP